MTVAASWFLLIGVFGLVFAVVCAIAITFALCSDWLNRRSTRGL